MYGVCVYNTSMYVWAYGYVRTQYNVIQFQSKEREPAINCCKNGAIKIIKKLLRVTFGFCHALERSKITACHSSECYNNNCLT